MKTPATLTERAEVGWKEWWKKTSPALITGKDSLDDAVKKVAMAAYFQGCVDGSKNSIDLQDELTHANPCQ